MVAHVAQLATATLAWYCNIKTETYEIERAIRDFHGTDTWRCPLHGRCLRPHGRSLAMRCETRVWRGMTWKEYWSLCGKPSRFHSQSYVSTSWRQRLSTLRAGRKCVSVKLTGVEQPRTINKSLQEGRSKIVGLKPHWTFNEQIDNDLTLTCCWTMCRHRSQ